MSGRSKEGQSPRVRHHLVRVATHNERGTADVPFSGHEETDERKIIMTEKMGRKRSELFRHATLSTLDEDVDSSSG